MGLSMRDEGAMVGPNQEEATAAHCNMGRGDALASQRRPARIEKMPTVWLQATAGEVYEAHPALADEREGGPCSIDVEHRAQKVAQRQGQSAAPRHRGSIAVL